MRVTILIAAIFSLFAVPAGAQEFPERVATPQAGAQGNINTVQDAVRRLTADPPPARPQEPVPVMPANDPGAWVTPVDYPGWAVNYDVTGRVGFRVAVDENGRVTRCEIIRSSGVPDLDTIACEKVSERARFVPARNGAGEPVASSWTSTVVWQIPDDDAPVEAPQPGFLIMTIVIEPDGTVSDCQVERAEGAASQFPDECPDGQRFEPILDADGNPQRTRIRMMARLVHEPLAP